jgi:hypothetical protein
VKFLFEFVSKFDHHESQRFKQNRQEKRKVGAKKFVSKDFFHGNRQRNQEKMRCCTRGHF